MHTLGLITEYNPFHKGHLLHIEKSKALTGADSTIAVMSGHFVQRGEPAILDKWSRTRIALESGIDLVLELPVHYATASAEYFAAASVALLSATGIVESLCFGSESGNLEDLMPIAEALVYESDTFKKTLETGLEEGLRFPIARGNALKGELGADYAAIIETPNNILGIEYLKALKRQNSTITPYTIKREGAGYHDENPKAAIASASAIRRILRNEPEPESLSSLLPRASYEVLHAALIQKECPVLWNDFFPLLQYKLMTSTSEDISLIQDVTEGLENRILSTLHKAGTMEEFLELLATKRYTNTKISRALLHILLQLEQRVLQVFNQNGFVQYIRILGFTKKGQELLRRMKKTATLPIIVNIRDQYHDLTSLQQKMLSDEIFATDLYQTISLKARPKPHKNDFSMPVIRI